ncbi:Trem-like transcript 4 protein [Myotis brandtii]|uniref:Trem-like transcript 4 protein n=1 Tax=Myotis brandtii TaxID=109478 RepID=S7NQJ4_MYOBR|nr:Trem-like transcript 4 protein [Myotis brandtii]
MAWEAPHLLPLVLLVLLASGSWEQQPEPLRKLEGEEVFLRCNYPPQQGWKKKTWCRVTPAGTCALLVTHPRRSREPGNPRYIIRDYPLLGYFTVTMTALAETDSGLYSCGLYESPQVINLRTVRLAVSRGLGRDEFPTEAWRLLASPGWSLFPSPPGHGNVILSVMVVLLLLVVLALLVILYFWQRRRARAALDTRGPLTTPSYDPYSGHLSVFDSQGSDKQLGSVKDTGDIHYASFTHLDPFGLEDPIYINTRPGLRPTPDPFLAVEYASIAKN